MHIDSKRKLSYSERGKLGAEASRVSLQLAYIKRIEDYNKNPKLCKLCGKPIVYSKKSSSIFCSSSCACTYNNLHRKHIKLICNRCGKEFYAKSGAAKYCDTCVNNEHSKLKRIDMKKLCLNCGEQFFAHNNKQKFCCCSCASLYRSKLRQTAVFATIAKTGKFPIFNGSVVGGETNRKVVKNYLEFKHGHKCSICGISEWMGNPVPLIVDHIDGNPLNHSVENFRLVCANCDALLPTYKSKNRGNGRKYRRVKYL